MATKSVIEIDILDEKFQTFAKEFAKFQKVLKDMPSDWKKAGVEAGKSTEQADKSLKNAKKSQDALNKSIKDGNVALKDVAFTTANIAKNMASMAFSAAKFLTFGSLVSGFGVGALAASTTNARTEARTAGLSIGELKAVETVVEPYLPNIKNIIENVASLQSNLLEQYKLPMLGMDKDKSVFENLFSGLKTAREAVKAANGNTDVAYFTLPDALKSFIQSPADLRNIAAIPENEMQKLEGRTKAEVARTQISDPNAAVMQRFYTALRDAGNTIESSFVNNLRKVTPKLEELTTAITDTIARFLGSKEFEIWMTKLSAGIEKFVSYLTSEQAIKDFNRLLTVVGNLANGMEKLLGFFGFLPKTKEEEKKEEEINQIPLYKNIPLIGTSDKNTKDVKNWLEQFSDLISNNAKKYKENYNSSFSDANKNKAKDFIKGSKLEGVDPKLAASIQSAGFTVESGKRSLKEENDLIAGYDSKGNPITATGRPVGGAKSHHIPGEAVDVTMDSLKRILAQYTEQELKDKFNLYAPLGKRDPNHLELWDKNRTDIYVNNPAGSGITVTTASQAGTQRTAN
jgi:hypothetical protein